MAGNLKIAARGAGVAAKSPERKSALLCINAGPADPASRVPTSRPLNPGLNRLAELRKPAAPEIQAPPVALPIWFAVLLATGCQACTNGRDHVVRWNCVSGRAVYTNRGVEVEVIEPLGVHLQGGHTIAVSWVPGETAYTVEVLRKLDCVA